ncbi:GtrA family protein [Leuconostoc pseudomesenteroides]|uniref:GtrA family protein n=1 Tax=Leuconostoc pseudomesenteroides TaxID=33968 RepID=UPI00166F57B7|nr:GtrA family protein [Leuconostoc pseudomesenteroides]MBS0957623.1 GtrA family protein [Leuconostoc pseudomesenteroides]MCT4413021.1 GtrA family protein [Leuconostoc pseudomesenteroides]
MEKIKKLLVQYQVAILYLVFGVLTTIVNIVVFALCYKVWHVDYSFSYVVAWFWAVLFAYLTNRKWVFHSTATNVKSVINEIWQFIVARIVTALLGYAILSFGVVVLKQDAQIWNVIQNIFVIVTNFVLSKLVIFKKKA